MTAGFSGDRKEGRWLLADAEARLRARLLPLVPRTVETYHLTLTTLLWCALIVLGGRLARGDVRWLWLVSLSIFLQYITDLLDGAVGRERDTGLVKWGYYMDHFLDFIFLCSIMLGYAFLLPPGRLILLAAVLAVFGAFMVSSFLAFSATNRFRISALRIGPTEIRLLFILANTALIAFGPAYLDAALLPVLALATVALTVTVYRTQRRIWEIDMAQKAAGKARAAGDDA